MYSMVEWSPSLDLDSFYNKAKQRGFENNSNQEKMLSCFNNERERKAWILYKDQEPIGSVVAHSFDAIGEKNSFRILARCCVVQGTRQSKGLMTAKKAIEQHQNITDQFFIPTCIQWAGKDANLYATSNSQHVGSQQLVNRIYFPILENKGIVKHCGKIYYRYTEQNIWKFSAKNFYESLKQYPRWTN